MALFLSSVQCFAIGIVIFAFIGFLQGWKRMLVVMGFTLAAVLFLYIGGANSIAQILFVRIPQTIGILTGGAFGKGTPPPPNTTQVLISALVTVGIAMLLGFVIGGRAFASEKGGSNTRDRFIGIIPGMVTGYAVISYVSHLFASNPSIAVGLNTPNPNTLGSYIAILFIIALVALIIGLLTARFGK
jgi:hypothetical protein